MGQGVLVRGEDQRKKDKKGRKRGQRRPVVKRGLEKLKERKLINEERMVMVKKKNWVK